MEIEKIRSMLFCNKSGREVSSSNNIDYMLFQTATYVGSPFTTIYIHCEIVDTVNHIWLKRNKKHALIKVHFNCR